MVKLNKCLKAISNNDIKHIWLMFNHFLFSSMAHIIFPFFPCLIYYTSKLPKSNHWLHKGTVYHKWTSIVLRHNLSCPWIPYVSSLILLKENCLIEIRHQFYQLLKETKRWKPEPLKKKFLWNTIVPTNWVSSRDHQKLNHKSTEIKFILRFN